MRVLIAEDVESVAANVATALQASGFLTDVVHNGEDAWFKGSTETYSAIILDIGLPVIDGLSVLKRWRQEGIATPVIILSARGSWNERVEGIDVGADDYLPKPFEMAELLSRLRAVLRRSVGQAQSSIEVGTVSMDLKSGMITVKGTPVNLTPLEFRLLQYLAVNKGRVITQSELAENLYSVNHDRDANAVEAAVSRLRRKLGGDVIQNKRGFGYFIQG
jgi:two-component system, OmpR family, response regulator